MADPNTLVISLIPTNYVAEEAFAYEANVEHVEHLKILDEIKVIENELFPHLAGSVHRVMPCVQIQLNKPPKDKSHGWVFGSDQDL